MASADEQLKTEKIELKKSEHIKNLIKPISLDSSKLDSLLKTELTQKDNETKVFLTGSNTGSFLKFQLGDYKHIVINSNGKEISFLCSNECEILEKLNDKEKSEVLVIWREVEKIVVQTNEKIKVKETTHIFYNSDKKTSFYPCHRFKKLPHLEKGCEGEACGILKYDKAIKSVDVFENAENNSKTIGHIKKCQKIERFESYTLLSELGWAEVLAPNRKLQKLGIQKGAIIQLTNSLGEGYLTACLGDHKIDAFEQGTEQLGDIANVKSLAHHKSEGWGKLKLPNKKHGFVPERENFYMGYYNYEPALLCPEDHPCGPNFLKTENPLKGVN